MIIQLPFTYFFLCVCETLILFSQLRKHLRLQGEQCTDLQVVCPQKAVYWAGATVWFLERPGCYGTGHAGRGGWEPHGGGRRKSTTQVCVCVSRSLFLSQQHVGLNWLLAAVITYSRVLYWNVFFILVWINILKVDWCSGVSTLSKQKRVGLMWSCKLAMNPADEFCSPMECQLVHFKKLRQSLCHGVTSSSRWLTAYC